MFGHGQELLRQSGHRRPQGRRRVGLFRRDQGLQVVPWLARLGALALALLALACPPSVLPRRQWLQGPAMRQDALELSDTLEKLIDAKEDTHEDREEAYQVVREWPQTTAAYAYGRAALVGRLAQIKGMKAGPL